MRVLFLVCDSLRADALGCYGSKLRTPTVDGLAAGGARFETVISSAPWTLPSLAAMLTGVWSHRLGLMKWEQPWPDEVPTLFDCFRQKGIETASFVFDPDHLFRACPKAGVSGSSQDTEEMLAWFRQRRSGDYFAFVHYWWTHVPYLRRKLALSTWNKVCLQILELLSVPDPEQRLANREQVKGLYALAVEEFSEQWLPALLDAARADVIVLIADHGESWGERLSVQEPLRDVFALHGDHLHDEVIQVPWVLHAPALVSPVVVRGLARSVDLMPTLVDLLELDHPALHAGANGPHARAGRSLSAGIATGQIAGESVGFSARNHDFVDAGTLPSEPNDVYVEFACRNLETKVITGFRGGGARQFDLRSDPGELRAGAPCGPAGAALTRALQDEMKTAVVAPHEPDDFVRMRRRLANLGYL